MTVVQEASKVQNTASSSHLGCLRERNVDIHFQVCIAAPSIAWAGTAAGRHHLESKGTRTS
jgi:hypothetical protein